VQLGVHDVCGVKLPKEVGDIAVAGALDGLEAAHKAAQWAAPLRTRRRHDRASDVADKLH